MCEMDDYTFALSHTYKRDCALCVVVCVCVCEMKDDMFALSLNYE